jgi:cell wall-associated NlpC family hydrolase
MSSRRLVLPSPARRLAVVAAAGAVLVAGALIVPTSARAAAARPHDPIGAVSKVTATATGLTVTGWAADPDAPTENAFVGATIDGRARVTPVPTSVGNAKATAKYGLGATPGFRLTFDVPLGRHTVCVIVRNTGPGIGRLLKCVTTPLGVALSAAQTAAHSPRGAVTSTRVGAATMRVRGWTTDPDWITHRSVVVLYVNGAPASTVTTKAYAAPRPAGAGSLSAFDITVRVSSGAHLGCVWVVNIGLGANTFLGCQTGDTRGTAGTGALTVPALNKKVVTEAVKHRGQRYVWGAEGPKTFDCSGLVQYSYHKFGFATPRTSEDQFSAARVIPASRALPGDLVFYRDTEGDVYHVGIYVSPGRTIAAIDEAHGVDYQQVWDPSSTTYGSFTHT